MFVCIATSLAPLFPLHLIFNMPLRSFSHCPASWSNLSPLTHFIPSDNDHVDNDYYVDKSGDKQSDENNDDEDDEDDDDYDIKAKDDPQATNWFLFGLRQADKTITTKLIIRYSMG